jgi:hypothetical protein
MSRPVWARWVTRISLAVGFVALVLTIRSVSIDALLHYFWLIGWWWIAVLVLEAAVTTLDAIAIRAFASPEQSSLKLRSAVLSQLAGRSVNAVTPSGNLGEAVKVSVLTEHVSQSRAVSTILLYNVVSFAIELAMVAVAAPVLALLLPMPTGLRWLFLASSLVFAVIGVGLYWLVHRGMLASVAGLARRLRILSAARYERWRSRLTAVDDKMKLTSGARKRDRTLGIAMVALSRLTSLSLSLVILHAIGEPITVAFVAGYTVGGFVVYMIASLVPMGVGVSEGGTWELFKALGEPPARGVALVLARRTTLVVYAAIGFVLVTVSETVERAREKARARDSLPPAAIPVQTRVVTPAPE